MRSSEALGKFLTIVSFDEHANVLRVTGDEDRATQSLRRRALSRALCAPSEDLTVDLSELSFGIFGFLLVIMMVLRPEGLLPERRRQLELEEGIGAGDAIGDSVVESRVP